MRRVLIAAGAAVLLTGCATDGAQAPATVTVTATETVTAEPGADTEPDTEPASQETDAPESGGALGTREAPLAAGESVTLGDWTVTVGATDTDPFDKLLEANQFNDPPEDGHAYLMAPVEVTFDGEEPATPWVSLSLKVVGGDGITYDGYCGVLPDSLNDVGEMYAGSTSSGNVCVAVPEAAIDGAVWKVEESFSWDDAKAFFALD